MDRDFTKLDVADAPWLTAPSARAVFEAIADAGHQIFYVGGCVRNAVLGAPVSDIDLSTSATPDEVMQIAQAADLNPVPTGIDHGTVTVVSGGVPYEVTTFRRDVQTDGRRAVVAFSTDITDDARRRDFTMNAIYADAQGTVIDPLGGMADLRTRRVRFIEDPDQRIREDYLRILRYFRFYAWYGDTSEGLDAEALAAIGSNLDGLETLSAERIGAEMRKLLLASDPSTSLAAMSRSGVLGTVLPGTDIRFVLLVIHSAQAAGIAPDWLGRLVALGGEGVPTRLRFSKVEQRDYRTIHAAAYGEISLLETAFEYGSALAAQSYLIQCALAETLPDAGMLARLDHAAAQQFPVGAKDLMPAYQGPALGARLAALKKAWIASGFELSKEELVALPPV